MTDLDRALGVPDAPPPAEDAEQVRLDSFRMSLHDSAGLAKIPQPDPLIDYWLAADSLAWVFGERGHGKTFLALDIAGCVSAGIAWHGYPTKEANVLYVVCEGASGLHTRVSAWEDFHRISHGAAFLLPRPPLHLINDGAALGTLAAEMDAGLIVIDTQNRATVGLDENSNVDMGRMIAALDAIREQTRACILTVHHSAIGTHRPRGHGSIDGAATAMIRVAMDGKLVKVENGKQRDSGRTSSLLLGLHDHAGGVVMTSPSDGEIVQTDSEAMIRRCLRDLLGSKDKVTHTDLKRACVSLGMADGTFNYSLRKQISAGLIVRYRQSYNLANPDQAPLYDTPEETPHDE